MRKNYWQGKRVLITGFEGFLGSNLTKALLAQRAQVVGLDIITNRKDTLLTSADYRKMKVVKGNVANYSLVEKIIRERKIEYIFHLAAEAIVGICNNRPMVGFRSNIEGTWKLLESCRVSSGVEAIVVASSDKAYGSHKVLPYKENTPLQGDHPYDVSKSCADLIANTYYHTYQIPVAVTRCGNIYGPGDFNFSRLIPDAIRCALQGKNLKIRSDGKFTRDYVYVADIVNGYLMLAEQLVKKRLAGEAFNFSDESPMSVLGIIDLIYKIMDETPNYVITSSADYEIKHQYLASAKARKFLKWQPGNTLNDGLVKTINWYKEYLLGR